MIKVNSETQRIEDALGAGGNVEIVPIFIPMRTYQILLEEGRRRGISVSDVLANAVINYLKPVETQPILQKEPAQPMKKPDMVVKRRK